MFIKKITVLGFFFIVPGVAMKSPFVQSSDSTSSLSSESLSSSTVVAQTTQDSDTKRQEYVANPWKIQCMINLGKSTKLDDKGTKLNNADTILCKQRNRKFACDLIVANKQHLFIYNKEMRKLHIETDGIVRSAVAVPPIIATAYRWTINDYNQLDKYIDIYTMACSDTLRVRTKLRVEAYKGGQDLAVLNSETLVSCSDNCGSRFYSPGGVALWDIATGKQTCSKMGFSVYDWGVFENGSIVAVAKGSTGHTMFVWDPRSPIITRSIPVAPEMVRCAIVPYQESLALWNNQGSPDIEVWDSNYWKCLGKVHCSNNSRDRVRSLIFPMWGVIAYRLDRWVDETRQSNILCISDTIAGVRQREYLGFSSLMCPKYPIEGLLKMELYRGVVEGYDTRVALLPSGNRPITVFHKPKL